MHFLFIEPGILQKNGYIRPFIGKMQIEMNRKYVFLSLALIVNLSGGE